MLELCISIAVGFLLVCWTNSERRERYVCPQCGSKRQDGHAKGCSWRT